MSKTRLAVLFGGISLEHEVSVITAVQLMKNVDKQKYELIPIYIDKSGKWWTGDSLLLTESYKNQDLFQPTNFTPYFLPQSKFLQPPTGQLTDGQKTESQLRAFDVAILCFHGGYGESGGIQGLLDTAGIPYQGPGVLSSAIAFDKIVTRQILATEGIGQTKYIWFNHEEWKNDRDSITKKIGQLQFPLFVKAANSGSSIGVVKVKDQKELNTAIETVLNFDQRVLIEQGINECIEVNVSVLGIGKETQASVPEQPIKQDELLSFADKYERGGGKKSGMASAQRRIPAPISQSLTKKLQELAQQIFYIFDCSGVVRIDFFVNPSTEEIFVTELNTIPGSMSFYLWEASGVKYPELIDRLVEIALKRKKLKDSLLQSHDTKILQNQ